MNRLVEGYFRLLKALMALCLLLMVALVFGNVVLRYAFNTGITLSEELSRWLFVYLVFLGAIVALREHAHLGVDAFVKRLAPQGRRFCAVASHLLMLWATWLLLKGSWAQTQVNWSSTAPSSGLSLGLFYAVGMVYGVSAGLILLWDLYRLLRGTAGIDRLSLPAAGAEPPAAAVQVPCAPLEPALTRNTSA